MTDEQGAPIAGAQVGVQGTTAGAQTGTNGEYVILRVPVGAQTVRARMVGFRPDSASVTVAPDQRASQDFTLQRDPLQLQTLVVTGTQTPRMNLDASVAVTSLTAQDIQRAVPRSTTEALRYVPGFTRVESSGGEVNENITHARHSGRRVREFLGGWAAGLSHDAHLLHECRQPVSD